MKVLFQNSSPSASNPNWDEKFGCGGRGDKKTEIILSRIGQDCLG